MKPSSPLSLSPTPLPGVVIVKPRIFADPRGCFLECYRREHYQAAGFDCDFVQDNLSRSVKGVLRGMHYQLRHPQAKLVSVVRGAVLDVVLDVRQGSPTFGQTFSLELNDTNRHQIFVPEGFAHGFCALSETVDFLYKCSTVYDPADERGLHYASFGFDWPINHPILSNRDLQLPYLNDLPEADLPSI